MADDKKGKSAVLTGGAAPTGRDGAIDWSLKMEQEGSVSAKDHVYRVIEVVGSSDKSIDATIRTAIARASQTLRHLRWFEVVRTSGHVDNGKVGHFQVTLKVGFTMEEAE